MYRNFLVFLLIACISSTVNAQNFEDTWSGYFSYGSIRAISQGNDKVYAASENAVFSYDLSTLQFETISTINGLSGDTISSLYYSEEFGVLVIGYENGLIEIVTDSDEEILSVVDILEKPTIPPNEKRINHFNEYEGILYIAADFGISEFNLASLEFGDSFIIGDFGTNIPILQTTVQPPYIYAASSTGGLRRASIDNPNLIDYEQWTTIALGNYSGVQPLQNEVYAVNAGSSSVVRIGVEVVPTITTVQTFGNAEILSFTEKNDVLVLSTLAAIRAYGPGFAIQGIVNNTSSEFSFTIQTGYAFNDTFYIGTFDLGMLAIPFSNENSVQILPDGPLRNDSYSIDASPGQVWVSYGEPSVSYNPFPLTRRGISNLKENIWTNYTYDDLVEKIGGFSATDLVEVNLNPENPEEVFISSLENGIIKISSPDDFFIYNESTSTIEGNGQGGGMRIYGSDFDSQGNLWFVQSAKEEGILRLSAGGQLQKFDITPLISEPTSENPLTEMAISREGYVFFGGYADGLMAFNPNNTSYNSIGKDLGNGNLPNNTVRCLAFDNNNRLWIGTPRGLRVLFNVGGFFEEDADTDTQPIIILEDGVPQELLFQQFISDIEVDGSNNKWIGTSTSGVFYLSPNGQETLLRFTKANSPLPSNNIQDISIDSFTGVVYFATDKGLVAYNGSATAPRENLEEVFAFPNPVRPGFTGNVTIDGLTANANVKITDIEGNLVFETTSEGGSVLWDTTAFGRYKVRSGVYLVIITGEEALETAVSKIMVIR
ncbi:type IX secretion system anionic LPS delivery protein PorZ [Cochleicola gelatinilyticus]|uniref:PorZ N-terminal beta-propeller domain-containing protein n=1 Tax=Cochleicola gelatinilyticus TaxID=1763537 RepID=A0A167J6R7_9FLAO|nr:T9SS type A sorting domain-containing protein [Cochleicola gelatinilyticus]OAB80380.1 hypothetical protein ULVI_06500 [Cochleicola gelatinilyticus]